MTAEKMCSFCVRSWTVDVSILELRCRHVERGVHRMSEFTKSVSPFPSQTRKRTTALINTASEGCPKPPETQTESKVSRVGSLSWNQQPWLSLSRTESAEGCRDTWDEVTFTGSAYLNALGSSPTRSLSPARYKNFKRVDPSIDPLNF